MNDEIFGSAVFGAEGPGREISWDFAADIDFYTLPAPVQVPSWFRWLPRTLAPEWLQMKGKAHPESLQDAAEKLRESPSFEHARVLSKVSVQVSATQKSFGEYEGGIAVVRFAAVKLWEWSRLQGFDEDDHGFPNASQDPGIGDFAPAYPYEVGFAFFEAARDFALPNAFEQAMERWWVQLSVHPGRNLSNTVRPLNYADVLVAAEGAKLGPHAITLLYLYGSWEETQSELGLSTGNDDGPLRLMRVPLRNVAAPTAAALWRRTLKHYSCWLSPEDPNLDCGTQYADSGYTGKPVEDRRLSPRFISLLEGLWFENCGSLAPLSEKERSEIATYAPPEVGSIVESCR